MQTHLFEGPYYAGAVEAGRRNLVAGRGPRDGPDGARVASLDLALRSRKLSICVLLGDKTHRFGILCLNAYTKGIREPVGQGAESSADVIRATPGGPRGGKVGRRAHAHGR